MKPDYSKYDYLVEEATYPDNSYHEFIVSLVDDLGPVRYLEVGAYKGSTLFYVLESNPMIKACVVDDFQISTHEELIDNIEKFGFLDRVNVLLGTDRGWLEYAMDKFKPDFVHLDADHSTEGLLFELNTVTQAESVPSVILVHDWIDPCVQAAVQDFARKNRNWQFTVNEDIFNGAAVFREKSK